MAHTQFELLKQRRFLPFFLTQCFGAFNDNVFRQAIIGLLFWLGVDESQRTLYTNLAPALFILPYFLVSATAGQFAEKLEKSKLIRITTGMEIGIMALAGVGFITQNLPLLLVALFATGVQSTLFGPVKYSILPSVLKPEELTGGNGLVEMGTSMSILSGMIFGGLIFKLAGDQGPVVACTVLVLLAVCGNLISRQIPKVDAGAPDTKVNWVPLMDTLAILRLARKQPAVRNAILGISWFWFFGTMLTAQLPSYAIVHLGGDETLYLLALALFSIGTGIGSLLCEKLSQRTVEIGLVPFGAIGMTVFCIDLYFARTGLAPMQGMNISVFIQQPGSVRIMLDLTLIGLFAGLYAVPLFALVQNRTPKPELSRVIAALNIQNAVFIVTAAVLALLTQRMLGWSIPQLFLATGIATAVVALFIFSLVPEFFLRFMAWIYIKLMYRVEISGVEQHVPDEGPALLVCNHVSYMDALLLSSAIPRPIRFVMYYKIFNTPGARWAFKAARAIPIAGKHEDAALMEKAFAEVAEALAAGELVCIFPEGKLTPDGEIGPFKSGMERILAANPVPVVPMAIRGMWASIFSRSGIINSLRLPSRIRARVHILAEAPVAGSSATAAELEQKVKAMRGEWA
jgi:1-acyl-sn-glycerol-3-phosphate acyltransferase